MTKLPWIAVGLVMATAGFAALGHSIRGGWAMMETQANITAQSPDIAIGIAALFQYGFPIVVIGCGFALAIYSGKR